MHQDTPPTHELEELLRPHWAALRSNFRGMLLGSGQPARPEDVEELLGEVLAEALSKFNRYEPSRRIIGWLTGFAVTILRRRPRQQRREQRIHYSEKLELVLAQPDRNTEQRELLEHWLSRLSPEDQQVLRLSYFQELTAEEIAAELNLPSANAARLKKTRALQKLKQIAHRDSQEA